MTAEEQRAWDEAVDASCRKAVLIQAGFRGLLSDARKRHQKAAHDYRGPSSHIYKLEEEISQGEALVGALGDVVRNIAAMKGQYPR